jgi:PTH1 family peptidyl-tRNA hydrolase
MLLLAGLGNPGREHAGNRHNIGYMAIDEIARRYNFAAARHRFHGELADGRIDGKKVLLLKPTTFMNRSGISVGEAARFYQLGPEDVVALHDELDLAPGRLKVKRGGSTAGHNGLKSIEAHYGRDFRRVRMGIGHPGHKDRVTGYVLKDFSKAELDLAERLIDALTDALPILVAGDDAAFMTRVALILNPPAPKPEPKHKAAPADPPATDDPNGL